MFVNRERFIDKKSPAKGGQSMFIVNYYKPKKYEGLDAFWSGECIVQSFL